MESSEILEKVEILSDLLAGVIDPDIVLLNATQFMVQAAEKPGAALVGKASSGAGQPVLAMHNLSKKWKVQIGDPESALGKICHAVLESGEPVPANPSLDLAAGIPVLSNGGVEGVLLVYGPPCSPEEIELLLHLCRVIGRSLHFKRFQVDRPSGDKELSALQLVATVLDPNLELDFERWIVQGMCRLLDVETCSLVFLENEGNPVLVKKTLSDTREWDHQVTSEVESGLIGRCIHLGEPIVANDVNGHPYFSRAVDQIPGITLTSMLCVPLRVSGQFIGAVIAYNKKSGDFDSYDQELMAELAVVLSRTINRSGLVRQLKVANADLEASRWELLRSRNTLRALFDNIPLSFYIVDRQYNLIAINMSRSDRVGKKPCNLVGDKCHQALYGLTDPCPGCRVGETLFSGKRNRYKKRQWPEGEDPLDWEINTYPIVDEEGRIIHAIMLEEDVTEKQRMESRLIQSEKLASIGQLAAGIAHEINNPLTAIIANAQLIRREIAANTTWEETGDLEEAVELISEAGNRAAQVVRNLLDLTRKGGYEFLLTDLNETIEKALRLLKHELVSRSIDLTFDAAPGLPRVKASQEQLQGVWINLIRNAIDALNEKGGGKIEITTCLQEDELVVSIKDNGNGITPEKADHIFEPFFTTKETGHGTGLGLTITNRIVIQHGGHIKVDSQTGKGTEFTVVLPVS